MIKNAVKSTIHFLGTCPDNIMIQQVFGNIIEDFCHQKHKNDKNITSQSSTFVIFYL